MTRSALCAICSSDEETKRLGLLSIWVDLGMTEGDLAARVTEAFGL